MAGSEKPQRGPAARIAGRLVSTAQPAADAALARSVDLLADAVIRARLAERLTAKLLESDLVERLTDALIEADVLDRVAARIVESEAMERAIERVLESHMLEETVERVMVSPEMQMIVERIANSDEVRSAIAAQSLGLANELAEEVRKTSIAADDLVERAARRVLRRRRDVSHEVPDW